MGSLFRSDDQVGSLWKGKSHLTLGWVKKATIQAGYHSSLIFPHTRILIGSWHERFLHEYLGWPNWPTWVQYQPAPPGSLCGMHVLISNPVLRESESALNLGLN